MITLQSVVANITNKLVTEEQAKEFALHNFAELCCYLKAGFVTHMLLEKDPNYKEKLRARHKACLMVKHGKRNLL